MTIYLRGKHGTRIAYTEDEAVAHEKDGYVRYDVAEEMAAKRKAMHAPPPKKRARKVKPDAD